MIFFQFAKYSYDVWKFCHANEHDKDGTQMYGKDGMQMGMQGRAESPMVSTTQGKRPGYTDTNNEQRAL